MASPVALVTGFGSYGAVEDVPIDEARRQLEVNVFGLARLVQLEEVADKIVKAALAKRPAPRGPVGRRARVITTSRDLLPDRVLDEVVGRTYGTR